MKRTLYVLGLILLLLTSLTSNAQVKMPRKAKAEYEKVLCQRDSLQAVVDSLQAVVNSHLSVIDSLCCGSEDNTFDAEYSPSDSLVRVGYTMQNQVFTTSYDLETEKFSCDVPDSVFIQRLDGLNSFIRLPFNNIIKNACVLYSEKVKSRMCEVMGNCEYYWPLFDEIFSHYGLPLELKALVIVESMMNPTATSRVGAKGLWQFMYGTAKGYGMRIDSFTDERMDPVKSTVGAARYLKNAYDIYKDWPLAIASYNCGAGNVNKAIRRSGGKRDFWEIYDYLPRETRGYVPAFVGALYATHYYKEHGIVPKPSAIAVPVDTLVIRRNLHFSQLEEVAKVPSSMLEKLNPQYMHKIVPGNSYPCVVRVPMEHTNAIIDAGDSLYIYKQDEYLNPVQLKKIEDGAVGSGNRIVYKVKSGDVLGKIARRYGVSVAQIKKWNGLKSNTIIIGQNLTIYTRKS